MAKEAVFTMKLEPELRDAFMAAAQCVERPASQIVREFMRDFVQQDREYLEFLRRRVELSHAQIAAGQFYTNDEVNAHMDELFKELEGKYRKRSA